MFPSDQMQVRGRKLSLRKSEVMSYNIEWACFRICFRALRRYRSLPCLRERVAFADQKYTKAVEDLEACQRRVAELEQENRTLRTQIPPPATTKGELGEETRRVLVHLFKTEDVEDLEARDVGNMAIVLGMERSVMLYHLDCLHDAKLAKNTGAHPDLGHSYWALTPEGRRYVMERGLAR